MTVIDRCEEASKFLLRLRGRKMCKVILGQSVNIFQQVLFVALATK